MKLIVPVAHDFICPWCWVALLQVERLQAEFDVQFDWIGYELFPDELEWPDRPTPEPPPANKPATPTRLEFILIADDIQLPDVERPKKMRTHFAHEAVEYAKTEGVAHKMVDVLYRAYWQDGAEINDIGVLKQLAHGVVTDLDAFEKAVVGREFKERIVGFDDEAYSKGVYNVPTYFIGDERFAEQPYVVLKRAIGKALA